MNIFFEIEILDEPDKVFRWIVDPDKAILWQKGVKNTEILKETPEKIGTTFIEEIEEGASKLVMYGVITGYVINQLISFHLESKIHKLDVQYSITGKDGKSRVIAESNIHWKFPLNLLSIFGARKIKDGIIKQTESEFLVLKKLCEEEKDTESFARQ